MNADISIKKQELIDYYCNLLIIQYQNDFNRSLLYAILDNVFAQFISYKWENFFNIDLAEGEHLDLLGIYLNITRAITRPGDNDPPGINNLQLSDEEFKILLKLKILSLYVNAHSYESINNALSMFFTDTIFCNINPADKRIIYYVKLGAYPQYLLYTIIDNKLLPKPIGAKTSYAFLVDNNDIIFTLLSKEKTTWNANYENNWGTGARFLTQKDVFEI